MRILILNHNLRGRGTWWRAWNVGRELARRGHAVTIWTAAPHHYYRPSAETDPELGERLRVFETPSWAPLAAADDGWGPLDAAWRLARVAWERFDLCWAFAHPPNVWLPAWVARQVRGRPLLYDWCDWYEGGIFPKRVQMRRDGLAPPDERWFQPRAERCDVALERRMLRLADKVTVISARLRELALEAVRHDEDVHLLPNGANLDGIRPRDREECRQKLGINAECEGRESDPGSAKARSTETGPILGYVSNYHPDQELLLEAVARARRSVPELRLLLAGPPFAAELVRRLDLETAILDLGRVDGERIGLALGAADALVLPLEDNASNRARVPYKFTDYLAAGRPIVTSPIGDLAAWFGTESRLEQNDGPIGLAAEPTPDALGDATVRMFDPSMNREGMGRAARRLAEREFAWPGLIDGMLDWLGDWLRPRSSRP